MSITRRTMLGHIAAVSWVSCTTNLQSDRTPRIAYNPPDDETGETGDTSDTIIVGGDTDDTSLVDTDGHSDSDGVVDSDTDLLDSDTDSTDSDTDITMACGYADLYVDHYC